MIGGKLKIMRREDLIKNWDIIEAFKNGEEIEVYDKIQKEWTTVCNPNFWSNTEYRIKIQSEYVPFEFEDHKLFKDKWIRVKGCTPLIRIKCFGPKGLLNDQDNWTSYKEAFNELEFEDGTPFGKLIN